MDSLISAFLVPLRRLRREPVSALLVVFILALTTGAAALIFTLIDALLLDPLPFDEPERLVRLEAEQGGVVGELSMLELRDIGERTDLFTDIAAYVPPSGGYTMSGDSTPFQASAVLITHNLFSVLGVVPSVGTTFPASYDRERSFGVLLNDRLFRAGFGSDPGVLEKTLTLDGAPKYEIFGVLPQGFDFPVRSDLYRSIFINDRFPNVEDRSVRNVLGVARLAPGVTIDGARARLRSLSLQLATDFPTTNRAVEIRLTPLEEAYTGDLTAYLWILGLGVGALLLVGCVNASNLLLARALPREAELALQAALGASRRRLVVQILAEGMILSAMGATLGLGLAYLTLGALRTLIRFDLPSWVAIEIDGSTILFLVLLALLTALAAGWMPARRLSRIEAAEALRAGGRGSSGSMRQRALSRLLVITQVTLAFVLVACTVALIGSFRELSRADLGFEPAERLSFKVNLPWFLYSRREPERLDQFHREVLADLEALPTVEGVALTTDLPFTEGADAALVAYISADWDPLDLEAQVPLREAMVSPTLFSVLDIPLLEGRAFSIDDRVDTRPVAIVSQRAAEKLWPGESAIGKSLRIARADTSLWEVVGVVGDVRRVVLAGAWQEAPGIYLPAAQTHPQNVHYVMSLRGIDPASLTREIEQVVLQVDPQQPIWDVETLSLRHETQLWREKAVTWLVSAFALVAALLATTGLYAVLAHSVRQRRHEMGLRMALGAEAGDITRLVVGEAGRMLAVGLALGGLITLSLLRWLASLVPFFEAPSPAAVFMTASGIAAAALLSALWPARLAAAVAPVRALREE